MSEKNENRCGRNGTGFGRRQCHGKRCGAQNGQGHGACWGARQQAQAAETAPEKLPGSAE